MKTRGAARPNEFERITQQKGWSSHGQSPLARPATPDLRQRKCGSHPLSLRSTPFSERSGFMCRLRSRFFARHQVLGFLSSRFRRMTFHVHCSRELFLHNCASPTSRCVPFDLVITFQIPSCNLLCTHSQRFAGSPAVQLRRGVARPFHRTCLNFDLLNPLPVMPREGKDQQIRSSPWPSARARARRRDAPARPGTGVRRLRECLPASLS
jgi:hypothetical protein